MQVVLGKRLHKKRDHPVLPLLRFPKIAHVPNGLIASLVNITVPRAGVVVVYETFVGHTRYETQKLVIQLRE